MPRRRRAGLVLACLALVGVAPISSAGEDPRIAEEFLRALRERGYFDLASDFIERLRADPTLGEPLKGLLDFHEGKALVDEASKTTDLARRRELLDRAAAKLEAFAKDRPRDAEAMEALVEIARGLAERGELARLVAEDAEDPEKKRAKIEEARSLFHRAAEAYERAAEPLEAAHQALAGFKERGDPRIAQRDRLRDSLLDARLKRGIAMFEEAQTHPPEAAERGPILEQAIAAFDALEKDYRGATVGMLARMYRAKCLEEEGKIGEAVGIYRSLMDQPSDLLRDLRRHVHHFLVVALMKRGQHALAADEAVRWFQLYDRRDERNSIEGLGVSFELARALDAQIKPDTPKAEKEAATKRIVEALSPVVRAPTRFKNEALALLKKYRPEATVEASEIARLSFDEATGQAEEAIAAREWDRAAALLRAALTKAGPRQADRLDLARYNLAYACYMNKHYPEAEVVAGWLARRRSSWELAPRAAAMASQAILDQYSAAGAADRASDLERYLDLAAFTVATWPEREEADDARIVMGQIHQGRGEYERAIADFASVRERSPRRLEARTRLGGTHWARGRALAREGKAAEAEAESAEAVAVLARALDDRRAAGAGIGDVGLLGNAADLGSALTESGKPEEAIAALKPIVEAQTATTGPAYGRLMEAYLLAQVNAGQVEPAIASMRAVERSGEGSNRARLYFQLGRLLETELDRLARSNEPRKLAEMKESFRAFLLALAESKDGRTFDSLHWAAGGLLSLGAGAEAETVLRRLIDDSEKDPSFMSQPGAVERLLRAKVKLATALRIQNKFDPAASVLDELTTDARFKRYIDPLIEKGELLEAREDWPAARALWQDVAQKLGRANPRPEAYYDAWRRAAVAYAKQGQNARARQTLTAVMRLNPAVGGPTMKKKYEDLLATLK